MISLTNIKVRAPPCDHTTPRKTLAANYVGDVAHFPAQQHGQPPVGEVTSVPVERTLNFPRNRIQKHSCAPKMTTWNVAHTTKNEQQTHV